MKALDYPIGSISGGGRYDNLTGIFGMPGLSGVGISFGADRIYDVLNGLNLYPADALNSTRLLLSISEKQRLLIVCHMCRSVVSPALLQKYIRIRAR